MTQLKQIVSAVLLVSGVVLVFAGVTRSVGVSPMGIVASLAAVVALLYSGAVFFGSPAAAPPLPADNIFVFDRTFRLVSGPQRGLPIRAVLPALGPDLEVRCAAVLDGRSERFSDHAGRLQVDAVPVRDGSGAVLYGMLILDAAHPRPADRAGVARV